MKSSIRGKKRFTAGPLTRKKKMRECENDKSSHISSALELMREINKMCIGRQFIHEISILFLVSEHNGER